MLQELRLFFTALQFFTRVPVPGWVGWSPEQLNASARWFPAVGLLVGAVAGGVYAAASWWWPAAVAVALSMVASVWLTGAFHEDGFADSCDGLGGGTATERVLAIMKDSRVGSYAVVGLVLLLLTKHQALVAAAPAGPLTWLLLSLASHAASRWSVLWVMARLDYVREDAQSKSKPIAQGIGPGALAWAGLWALVPLAALAASAPAPALGTHAPAPVLGTFAPALALIVLVGVTCGAGACAVRYLRRRLGGYVGDTLGATQQLTEVALLLAWLALAKAGQ